MLSELDIQSRISWIRKFRSTIKNLKDQPELSPGDYDYIQHYREMIKEIVFELEKVIGHDEIYLRLERLNQGLVPSGPSERLCGEEPRNYLPQMQNEYKAKSTKPKWLRRLQSVWMLLTGKGGNRK